MEKGLARNVGVYELLERAKRLKTEGYKMQSNPFYRTPRRRHP